MHFADKINVNKVKVKKNGKMHSNFKQMAIHTYINMCMIYYFELTKR